MTKNSGLTKSEAGNTGLVVGDELSLIRMRPLLYLEAMDRSGIAQLVEWLVEFAVRGERFWPYRSASLVVVEPLADQGYRITDNGSKLTNEGSESEIPSLTRVFAESLVGGDQGNLAVVTAFSRRLVVVTHHHQRVWRQVFVDGAPNNDIQCLGSSDQIGTAVEFWPSGLFSEPLPEADLVARLESFVERRGGLRLASEHASADAKALAWRITIVKTD